MGRQTRAKYRRWRRADEEARRSRQAWRVASLTLVVIAAFAAWLFYDRVFREPEPVEPPLPPKTPRPVTLIEPKPEPPPPEPAQEQASSGEKRPELPKTRADTRPIAIDREWRHEQPNVSTSEVSQSPVPSPAPVTVTAPPPPPAPPAPVPAAAPRAVSQPKPKPTVRRVTQEKKKSKPKPAPKKPVIIQVPPKRPGPPGTSTLHEVEATPVED